MKRINLIKAKDYLFIYKTINSNVKLSEEVIKINFKEDLVYKNIYFLRKKDHLYIYNTNYNGKLFIPEGFILFSSLESDGIFIFKNPLGYYNIIIKENNILKNDFIVNEINDFIRYSLIYEYNLPIENRNYNDSITKGFKNVSYIDLIRLNSIFSFKKEKIVSLSKELSLPFLISVIFIYITFIGLKFIYQYENKSLLSQYSFIRKKIINIDYKINFIKDIYNNLLFVKKYHNPLILKIANLIAKIVDERGFRLSYLKIDYINKYILFTVDGNNSTFILEKLAKIKYFKNLRLTGEVSLDKTTKRYRFEGQLND